MKIIRDGKVYELTKQELWDAYEEQLHLYDKRIAEERMADYLSDEEYEQLKDNQEFIDEAAYEVEEYRDNNDISVDSLREIFSNLKNKYLEKEKEALELE